MPRPALRSACVLLVALAAEVPARGAPKAEEPARIGVRSPEDRRLDGLRKRIGETQRVPPWMRKRILENVEEQHRTPAGRGFRAHVLAAEQIDRRVARGAWAPLLGFFENIAHRIRPPNDPPARGHERYAEAIERALANQRKKLQLATVGPEVVQNLADHHAHAQRGEDDQPRVRAGRTRSHSADRGASSLARKTVVTGKDGLPTIVIDADAPLLSLLRRTVVTKLGRYQPGAKDSPNGTWAWSEAKRGILWELPILLSRYVKQRTRGKDADPTTAYAQLSDARAKAGERVTLDDYLRIGEMGDREMALLANVLLQDLGFEARYAEAKPGQEWGRDKNEWKWYRREYVNLIRQPMPEYELKKGVRGDGTRWEIFVINEEPFWARSFNGQPANEQFEVFSMGGLRADPWRFWIDGGTDHMGAGTSPRFSHAGETRFWRQAKPFETREHIPSPRYREQRPPPERRVQISFVTDASLPNDHLSAWGPIRGYGLGGHGSRGFDEFAKAWTTGSRGSGTRGGGTRHEFPGRDNARVMHLRALGLGATADAADIRRAYRKLVKKLHPDAGGDAKRFKDVNAAYEALGGKNGLGK